MNTSSALQALLNNTATEEDITLLKRLLASGEISIGGNVNQSVIIIGSSNTMELPPAALDRLNARPMLGNLDRDLTGEEIAAGLRRLDKLLPNRAPVLLPHYKEQVGRLRPTLKTEVKSLSETSRRERVESLAAINSICVEALDVSFNGLSLGEEAPKYDARSPFRGLESFRPEDSEFFFGREALTHKLVGKIKAHPFLAVLGASGSGKSSLVMAGVIPALDLDYVIFRPGTKPLDELESARGKSLIVVDQFEELFTLTRDESTHKEFIARLLDESSRARIILTLRSDFLGEVSAYRTLSAEIQNHLEIIPPMDMDELRRAMEGQAGVVGLRFEADLSQQILDDVAGEPGAMPLLQHALWELWNRRHGRNLRASEYRAFGGVKQAITSTAEKVYADCSKPEQDQVRDIFLRLTRLDEGDEGRDTRRRVPLGDLIPSVHDAASITLLLDKLANARLIVKTANEGKAEAEVAHEALIRHWERLRIWLNEDRDALRLRESVSEDARRWENAGRYESMLNHRGGRLDEALSLGENSRYGLTANEQSYLNACMALRNKEQREHERRRRTSMTSIFAVITVIMAILTGWGISSTKSANTNATQVSINSTQISVANTAQAISEIEKKNAEEQKNIAIARQLAAQVQPLFVNGNSKQHIAVLLAIQSMRLFPTGDAAQILQNNTLAHPIARMMLDDFVDSIAFSPDGKYVVSGSDDGTARVWEVATSKEIARMTHASDVNYVAFSPDSKYVISGSSDGTARVWEVATGKEIARMTHASDVNYVAFSPDGKYVVSGGCNQEQDSLRYCAIQGSASVWEAITGKEIAHVPYDGSTGSIAISPNGRYVVSGRCDQVEGERCSQGSTHVWEAATGKEIVSMPHNPSAFAVVNNFTVAFSPDSKVVASAEEYTIRVWDVATGKEIAGMTYDDEVESVAFSPDGKYIVSSEGNTAHVWDIVTGKEISHMTHDSSVFSVTFSPDGKSVGSESVDGTVCIWDVATGKEVARITLASHFAFSFDGKYVVTDGCDQRRLASSCTYSVRVWEAATRKDIVHMTHDANTMLGIRSSVYSVSFSPDGKYVVSGSADSTARVWEAITGKEIARMAHDFNVVLGSDVNSVAFSPDGKYVVSGSQDKTARVWKVTTGEEIARMTHENWVMSVAFSPDGKYVVSGSEDDVVHIWEVATGKEIARMTHENWVTSVAFSPDGKYVVSGSGDGTARVWEVATGKEIARMTTQGDNVSSVAFSPNGRYVVSGSWWDMTARVWEVATGKEIARMIHEDTVLTVAFSSDGKYVVSGSGDNFGRVWDARVWEAATGKEMARMTYDSGVNSVAFSPDDKYVVSGILDGTIHVWIWRPEDLITEACSRVTRNLTRYEWKKYIGDALPYQAVCPNLPIEAESTPMP